MSISKRRSRPSRRRRKRKEKRNRRRSMNERHVILLSLFFLSACDLIHTQWNAPPLPVASWQGASSDSVKTINHTWWQEFNDETLNGLIAKARTNSPDAAIALARVKEARAAEQGAIAEQLPTIGASANAERSRSSSTVTNRPAAIPHYNTNYNAQFDASWEINLFGIEPALRAAKAGTSIAEANYDAALVTLSGDVARSYF